MRVTAEQVYNRAFEIWREQEMGLPERERRMEPDALDHANGNWGRIVRQAADELGWKPQPHGEIFELPK